MEDSESSSTPQVLRINYQTMAIQDLLKRKFNNNQRERLSELAIKFVNQIDFQDEFVLSYVYEFILDFDIEPTNVDVLRNIATALSARTELAIDVVGMLTEYFEGSKLDAFKMLIDSEIRDNYYVRSIIDQNYADESIQMLENLIAGDCPTLEQANYLVSRGDYRDRYDRDAPLVADTEAVMKSLIACFPDDETHRMSLLQHTIGKGFPEKSKITQLLGENYEHDKTNEPLRAAHFIWSKNQEHYDTALAIAQDGGDDLRYREILDDILARNDESPNLNRSHPDAVLHMIRDIEPEDDDTQQINLGLPKNVNRAAAELAKMGPTNTNAEVANVVRHFWRNINLQTLNQDPFMYVGNSLTTFLSWPADQTMINRNVFYGYSIFSSSNPVVTFARYLEQDTEDSSAEPGKTDRADHRELLNRQRTGSPHQISRPLDPTQLATMVRTRRARLRAPPSRPRQSPRRTYRRSAFEQFG